MKLSSPNSNRILIRLIIPIIILINIYFFLFESNNYLFFSEIPDITFFHFFMVFLAVKSIAALLIIFGHNIKKYFGILTILILIQFLISCAFYFDRVTLFHQFIFLNWSDSVMLNLAIDFLFLLCCVFLNKGIFFNKSMNRYFKLAFYFLIPFIFYFTFSRTFNYINENYCRFLNTKNELVKDLEQNHPLLNKNITSITYFKDYQFESKNKYVVYLMDSDCKNCWRGISNIKSLKSLGYEIIFFDVGKNDYAINEYELRKEKFYQIEFFPSLIDTFPIFPTTLILDKNKIVNLYFQQTPSTYELIYGTTEELSEQNTQTKP